MSATLTVEVKDADAVSRAAQSALELTRTLGGFVVSSSVATGDEGSASIVVRVPVDEVQDAITGLSGLGRIVSQQVTTADRQESIDAAQRRTRSLRAQIAVVTSRLDSGTLDAETQARLEARLKNLKADLLAARRNLGALRAEARMSTIQLTVVTPGAFGAVVPPSRIDRAVDEALNVLAWEGVVALGLAHRARAVRARRLRRVARTPALPPARGGEAARDLGRRRPSVAISASATTFSGRPEIWLALRSRANASSSERPSRCMRIPFARSIAFRAASASASESASSRSARSSSCRAVAVAIAGSRSVSRNGLTR